MGRQIAQKGRVAVGMERDVVFIEEYLGAHVCTVDVERVMLFAVKVQVLDIKAASVNVVCGAFLSVGCAGFGNLIVVREVDLCVIFVVLGEKPVFRYKTFFHDLLHSAVPNGNFVEISFTWLIF